MSAQQRTGRPNQRYNNNRYNYQNPAGMKNRIRTVKQGHFKQGQFNVQNNKQRREAIIAQNLQHMQQIAEKKRVAQELYYGNGRSPMVKTASGNFVRQDTRISVQHRLGVYRNEHNINVNMNRPKFINRNNKPNFNNNQVKFVNRKNNGAAIATFRSDKINRVQNFQNKKVIKNNLNNTNMGMIRTVGSNGKVLFLRPSKSISVRKTQKNNTRNLSISVANDGRHNIVMDPVLQQEIKMIQAKGQTQVGQPPMMYNAVDVSPCTNGNRLAITATRKTMNERFSSF